jgi:hypothetical protein
LVCQVLFPLVDCCFALATSNAVVKTGGGSSAHAGSLPWTPDGPRRMPCGQGLPPGRPAGKVAEGPE